MNISIQDYLKTIEYDHFTLSFNNIDNIKIFIQYYNNDLCIELVDNNGNSMNINSYIDITLNTKICDIRETILNYIICNYFYTHC